MADLQQLEDSIVALSLLDAAQLVKKLEERLGVSAAAAAPVMVAGGGAAAGAGWSSPREQLVSIGEVDIRTAAARMNGRARPLGLISKFIIFLLLGRAGR